MKHQWGTNSASAVETRVTYDPLSRLRNTEKTQGAAWMSVLGRSGESGVHTDYSYTDRYELTSSGKYLLNADWSVGAAAAGTARDYAFDPMGNRTSDQAGSYTPNELNQYTATPTAATLTYDANGNLTGDGAATYAYDAENRLITMNRDHGASSHYTYDYLGRRIRRTATGMTTQRYLYDGWNLIAELDDSGTITRQFIWGLDVSGSTQGAGGVGGLLEIDAGGTSQYYPIYDASHNVIGLYSGTGAIAAAYEYDPFGNKQTGLGTYAAANPFRFSTKYTDPDSGLVYYGMRYYSAKLGRFLNQDPIEEAGGNNLFAFVGNGPTNGWDVLGLDAGDETIVLPRIEYTDTRGGWQFINDYQKNNTIAAINADASINPATVQFHLPNPGSTNGNKNGKDTKDSENKPNVDKWTKKDCDDLLAQMSVTNKAFNSASNMLRDQLAFQYSSAVDLYLVDRAIDASINVVGSGVGAAVKGTVLSSNLAKASSGTAGQLMADGLIKVYSRPSFFGRVIDAAETFTLFGWTGKVGSTITKNILGAISPSAAVNNVRQQTQSTANSLDRDANTLNYQLNGMREDYAQHCK